MRIFSWMQNKLIGKEKTNKPNPILHNLQTHCKEEFSDWPNGLLAIGTFGNNSNLKEDEDNFNLQEPISSSTHHDHSSENHISAEEFREELRKILDNRTLVPCSASPGEETKDDHHLVLQNLLDSLESPRDDKTTSKDFTGPNGEDSGKKESRFQRARSLIRNRGKDVHLERTNNVVGKKSLSFLLKKTFLCRGGFSPAPIPREPFPEPRLDKLRLEKILRAILNKKIYPQSPSPRGNATKRYLDMPEIDTDDENVEKGNEGSKWVKTDSEYIVLEI